jgi:signal transduction histidine kinase
VYGGAVRIYHRRVDRLGPGALLGLDVAICVVLLAFGVDTTMRPDLANGTVLDTALLPLVLAPVLLRRRWPLAACAALLVGSVLSGIPTFDQFRLGLAIPAGLLILFPTAARLPLRQASEGLGLVLAAMVFVGLTDRVLKGGNGGVGAMIIFSFPLCLGSWGAGRAAWSRERMADELASRSEHLRLQRERTAALAVETERAKLATDLDAAVRGSLRRIIALADDETQPGDEPHRLRDNFGEIERLGRASLNEMRELLGTLRSDERGSREPRPTLAEIESVLEQARQDGSAVHLALRGHQRPLPPGIELAAYRAVQHALASIASPADRPAMLELEYLPHELRLEVRGIAQRGVVARASVDAARERIVSQGGEFSHEVTQGARVLRAMLPVSPDLA